MNSSHGYVMTSEGTCICLERSETSILYTMATYCALLLFHIAQYWTVLINIDKAIHTWCDVLELHMRLKSSVCHQYCPTTTTTVTISCQHLPPTVSGSLTKKATRYFSSKTSKTSRVPRCSPTPSELLPIIHEMALSCSNMSCNSRKSGRSMMLFKGMASPTVKELLFNVTYNNTSINQSIKLL